MGETARRIGSAMIWSVLARGSRIVLGLASGVIVVRSLGDHDYGVLSLIRTILMFVMALAGLGLAQAVLKFLPEFRVHGARREARRLLGTVIAVYVVMWLGLVAIGYLGRSLTQGVFHIEGIGVLVAAAVALFGFELFYQVFSFVLNSNYDTQRLSISAIVSHVVYIVMLAVLLPGGLTVLEVLIASAAGFMVACFMLFDRLKAAVSFGDEHSTYQLTGRRLWGYALPFGVIGLLNLIVWRQSETLLLAYFRTPSETGYFDLAYRLPQMILEFIPGTVWPLVMAGVSEAYARNPGTLAASVDRYYRMLFILCAPVCVVGVLLGGKMIGVLYGSAMLPAAVPTQLFFAVLTVSFLSTPLSMALYVMEKTHVNLVVYVFLTILNVGLDLLLIPRYGVYGAIAPVALVMLVSPIIYRVVVGRLADGVRVPAGFIAKCFVASSPVLLLWPLLRFVNGVPELLAGFVVAAGVLLFSFKLLRVVGREEYSLLSSIPFPFAERLLKFVSS